MCVCVCVCACVHVHAKIEIALAFSYYFCWNIFQVQSLLSLSIDNQHNLRTDFCAFTGSNPWGKRTWCRNLLQAPGSHLSVLSCRNRPCSWFYSIPAYVKYAHTMPLRLIKYFTVFLFTVVIDLQLNDIRS